jgi:hypothetical protein
MASAVMDVVPGTSVMLKPTKRSLYAASSSIDGRMGRQWRER